MVWTKEPPTATGYYWRRITSKSKAGDGGICFVCRVVERAGELWAEWLVTQGTEKRLPGGRDMKVEPDDDANAVLIEWAGPIERPEE